MLGLHSLLFDAYFSARTLSSCVRSSVHELTSSWRKPASAQSNRCASTLAEETPQINVKPQTVEAFRSLFFLSTKDGLLITDPSGTVCWPGGARGLHTSPDCDRTCLCCSCDSHCFVPPAMETGFKTTVGDVTLPPVSHPKSLARWP